MFNATIISKTLPHDCLLPQHKSIEIKNTIDKISNINFKRSFEKDSIGILIFMIECILPPFTISTVDLKEIYNVIEASLEII